MTAQESDSRVDLVVEAVRADLLARSERGLAKYGVTLDRNRNTLRDRLQHAYEECLDQANYLKGAMAKYEPAGRDALCREIKNALVIQSRKTS